MEEEVCLVGRFYKASSNCIVYDIFCGISVSIFSLKPGSIYIRLIDKVDPNKTLVVFHSLFPVRFSLGHYCSSFYIGGLVSKSTLVPTVYIGINTVSSTSIINHLSLLYGFSQNSMPYACI